MAKEVAEEYASSLSDLTVNSKPLINMLTILAEENVDHAGVIVETVEKHLEKVHPDIKLPVLYLVDSIIKNVGGEYVQKFSQAIVNMFTKTFKQVDEKTRSQMYKLRETWFDVFPATKLYQLDVKVNLIDPAWPIQSHPHQPQQSKIHVNPIFLKKPLATSSTATAPVPEEEKMRSILARKEEELLMLQRKKIEMELEQARRQLELAEKNVKKPVVTVPVPVVTTYPNQNQIHTINGVPTVVPPAVIGPDRQDLVPIKQRLGPPVSMKNATAVGGARIAPVSGAMLAGVRRDPRLARHNTVPAPPASTNQSTIASNVFDIKPLSRPDRVIKRKNAITIDVRADAVPSQQPRVRRDPRLDKRKPKHDDRPKRFDDKDKKTARKPNDVPKATVGKLDKSNSQRSHDRERPPNKNDDNASSTKQLDDRVVIDNDDFDIAAESKPSKNVVETIQRFPVADAKRINQLPPIPKISNKEKTDEMGPSPVKKKKESARSFKKKKRDSKESSSPSPDKKAKPLETKEKEAKQKKLREEPMEVDAEKPDEPEVVAFKELKNYHRERYMRRNKEKSESPEKTVTKSPAANADDLTSSAESIDPEASNMPDIIVEKKDVDLRILQPVVSEAKAAGIAQKRPSTEALESKNKKNKLEKFDILFGDEDVDLRQLPQVEEASVPIIPTTVEIPTTDQLVDNPKANLSPIVSPENRDWTEVKEHSVISPDEKKVPSQLDLVRAKLAEATKGKDRLGRPLLFTTSGERRRTISTEDTDLRVTTKTNDLEAENDKESIKIIMSQAEEQYKVGHLNKEQYKTLMVQVLQLNERLKLKEAKQRESLEVSKRKLQRAAHLSDEDNEVNLSSPNRSPQADRNTFGDIDERVIPHAPSVNRDNQRIEPPTMNMSSNHPEMSIPGAQDSDLRVPSMGEHAMIPNPPRPPIMPPIYLNTYNPMWRGPRPREDFNGPRMRSRHPAPPFFRGKYDKWNSRPYDPRMPIHPLPRPMLGVYQGECPLRPYTRSYSPPPLGTPGRPPPTDYRLLEYIDQDPMKTIEIDGVPREIRFYGDTAVIMLDWDDPREIKFLPGTRRITFDNKDSVVLGFNEGYATVDIDDHEFRIRFGAPTRELYVNDRWYECFFGGPPMGIVIDGKPKLIQLEGPLPKVDIGTEKKTNLVAGKINLIVDGQHMFPVFLDAKPQKFNINGTFITLRFVDALKTVLINEKPYKVEFGGLPRPIFIGKNKHFVRFSVLPRSVKPGHIKIQNMEGRSPDNERYSMPAIDVENKPSSPMETNQPEEPSRPEIIRSPEGESNPGGLDMLASLMPTTMAPASQFSGYSLAEPMFPASNDKIPGLDTPADDTPVVANVSFVSDLFAKLVATGIVQAPNTEVKPSAEKPLEIVEIEDPKPKFNREDRNTIKVVNLLKPDTLKVKQPGLVSRLYGGMQCSGCGARFPPEHTVRYSQHLDWHFRQNRRERDSARRAHSRHWHYDLSDWVQYEEIEDLEEREKSWFETGGAEGEGEGPSEPAESEAPSVPAGAPVDQHCALCGDKFHQFYNEDKEEWHLRKAVRHEDKNYHPLCFEDYKASLTKEEPQVVELNDTVQEETTEEPRIEETIEIKDVDDVNSQSDNESVVEVIDNDSQKEESQGESQGPLEIPDEGDTSEPKAEGDQEAPLDVDVDDGDEDDVVLKAEPVEEVVVDDDLDTDDETTAERAERDRLAHLDFTKVKVKVEPVDPDDEPVITAEEEPVRTNVDTTHTTVLSSIDGNVQLEATSQLSSMLPVGGIRINITKPITSIVRDVIDDKMLDDVSADDEPLPPGEEPELVFTVKPTLQGVNFLRRPPVQKGSELSGLCSIM